MKETTKNHIKKSLTLLFNDEYYNARTNINSSLSMLVNFIWALIKIIFGVYTGVFLLCVSGVFTLGLGVCKIIYFRGIFNNKKTKYVIRIGIILFLASAVYTAYMIFLFYNPEEPRKYGMILSIAIAAVAFFKLFFSINGIHKMRKQRDPLVMSVKGVNLCGALSNIVLTQSCLLSANSILSKNSISYYNGLLGTVAGVISMLVSIFIIVFALKNRNFEK